MLFNLSTYRSIMHKCLSECAWVCTRAHAAFSCCVCVFAKIHRDFMEWMQIQCFSWTIIKSERFSAQFRDGFFCLCFFCLFVHSFHSLPSISMEGFRCRWICCCMLKGWNQPNKFEAACDLQCHCELNSIFLRDFQRTLLCLSMGLLYLWN